MVFYAIILIAGFIAQWVAHNSMVIDTLVPDSMVIDALVPDSIGSLMRVLYMYGASIF